MVQVLILPCGRVRHKCCCLIICMMQSSSVSVSEMVYPNNLAHAITNQFLLVAARLVAVI